MNIFFTVCVSPPTRIWTRIPHPLTLLQWLALRPQLRITRTLTPTQTPTRTRIPQTQRQTATMRMIMSSARGARRRCHRRRIATMPLLRNASVWPRHSVRHAPSFRPTHTCVPHRRHHHHHPHHHHHLHRLPHRRRHVSRVSRSRR